MASSPPSNTNSPIPPTLSLPKKRSSLNLPVPAPAAKRRKPSTGPSGLRQTSFPPETTPAGYARPASHSRSPSVESSILNGATPSLVSSAGGGGGGAKKRRRPRRDREGRSATGSVRGGGKAASAGGTGTGSVVAGQGEEDVEEEEEHGEVVDTMIEGGKMDEAALKQEREHLSMLVEALDRDQAERYDVWRRVRLKKETVRKITNQTLSQSVPASVVTTINGYTKIFIGELIDRARDVQLEWMAAEPTMPSLHNPWVREPVDPSVPISERIKERDRGRLTPDHLREALRRYKKDREGGGAGFQGLSLEGRENTASRMGGRKLFR